MFTATASIALYLISSFYLALQLSKGGAQRTTVFFLIATLAIAANGYASFQWLITDQGINFGLLPMTTVIAFTVNFIVLGSRHRKQLQNLFLVLFPLSALILFLAMTAKDAGITSSEVSIQMGFHVLASILSYSLLTLAAFQALFLSLQEWRLRHKHFGIFSQIFPSIQTMESLLFEALWVGFGLLTLSLATGLIFFEDFFAQHLAHKTFFSIFSWIFFAILLWGRHTQGWRGKTAVRWTLSGFITLAVAYWGTKFVLEVLLSS
tara:strand:+ start:102 stop:893 length:792 start_codon:yes stop_codon:yes gene_type:complete